MKIYIPIPSWRNDSLLNALKEKAEVVVARERPSQEEFQKIIKEYDWIIIGRLHTIDKEVIKNANLQFIGLIAKWTSNIDIEECKKKNIAVFYTPEANISSVAEHVMCLILCLAKNVITLNQKIREWYFDEYRYSTIDIKDKVLGIIGAGAIGKEVIHRAQSFGMRILCHTLHPKKHWDIKVEFTSLKELLRSSDFVSVNIPLNTQTKNFIDKEDLALMKKSSFLINTSRGGIVNEEALFNSLHNKEIAGAWIDVFAEEPTHRHDFFTLDNTIVTPHIAWVSKEALERMEEHIIADILGFLDKKETKYRLI